MVFVVILSLVILSLCQSTTASNRDFLRNKFYRYMFKENLVIKVYHIIQSLYKQGISEKKNSMFEENFQE